METEPHPIDLAVGRAAKQLRQARGLLLEGVAIVLGIGHRELFEYEAGKGRLNALKVSLLACYFDVKVEYFYRDLSLNK